jgi:hypothetical protein
VSKISGETLELVQNILKSSNFARAANILFKIEEVSSLTKHLVGSYLNSCGRGGPLLIKNDVEFIEINGVYKDGHPFTRRVLLWGNYVKQKD